MKETVIMIGSITYAMKAQKALQSRGVDSNIIKRADVEGQGCNYGIRCRDDQIIKTVAILKELNIPYKSVRSEEK